MVIVIPFSLLSPQLLYHVSILSFSTRSSSVKKYWGVHTSSLYKCIKVKLVSDIFFIHKQIYILHGQVVFMLGKDELRDYEAQQFTVHIFFISV